MGKIGVSCAHPQAAKVGIEVMEKGGNAIDAAIAVSLSLGVVEPYASGIGGGGVMLIHQDNKNPIFFDYRECAPNSGILSKEQVGIPGLLKGLEAIHQKLGTIDWSKLVSYSTELAEKGFFVTAILHERLKTMQTHLFNENLEHFYPNGRPIGMGCLLIQEELAEVLQKVRNYGSRSFYEGKIPIQIINRIEGIHDDDFEQYSMKTRDPVQGQFAGYDLISAPAPLAGTTLVQALTMAESFLVEQYADQSFEFLKLMAAIINECQLERKKWMGDPFHVTIPDSLLSESYIEHLMKNIIKKKFTPFSHAIEIEVNNTTHFSVTDQWGTMVSATHTISDPFGSGVYINGFFLNNQLQNFTKDKYSPNSMEPGKRPASNIAPTILASNGRPIMTIGASGGTRIPHILTRLLINLFKHKVSFKKALSSFRYYVDQNHFYFEKEVSSITKERLTKLGYDYIFYPVPFFYGGIHGLMVDEHQGLIGAADPRRGGGSLVKEVIK
ncbi:hypothetical protein ELQ35_04360 [Peribacillus cavernae]|uniref:Gamma-glutamyltransferase n=1 Tax=Peribacillus cavernae TaxID=1674310 RepID=A0A3S0UH65_9BACI|nr:gamma-glutamyltransferase [Peribacillus cavernae]MDQ0218600.1 gamma-glutamyltranspeptidase/glutathione hydrolase [Peribacillus cavernae]RUQ31585.1 hypothetical protein ELQ35_04360 [Peribacillus cavernae]